VLAIDVIPAPPQVPALSGVDSIFIAMAETYAQRGRMADPRLAESSRRAAEGGRRLFEIADSISAKLLPPKDSVEATDEAMAESIRRYNAGAESLQKLNLGNTAHNIHHNSVCSINLHQPATFSQKSILCDRRP